MNTFTTLGDFMAIGKAATVGDQYANLGDLLGPFGKFATHGALGRDECGNRYPGSQWWGAAQEVLDGLPQLAALARHRKKDEPPLKPIDVTRRDSLQARVNSALKQTVLSSGWLDGVGSLLGGGFSPRSANPDALEARYWHNQDPATRHKHEMSLLKQALKIQGELLQEPVPADVRRAVDLQSEIEFGAKQQARELGRNLTPVERAQFTLDHLAAAGRIPDDKLADLRAQAKKLVAPEDISAFQSLLMNQYGDGKALRQWDRDVRTVASFTDPAIFNEKAAVLYEHGLAPQKVYRAAAAKLTEYGRGYLKFEREARKLAEAVKQGNATTADLHAFEEKHDVPVNGLPSFVRVAWTHQSAADREADILHAETASWTTLSSFEKELTGRKPIPHLAEAWQMLARSISNYKAKQPAGERSLQRDQTLYVVKAIDKYYPGFRNDWQFSQRPLFRRIETMSLVTQSPAKADWSWILASARTMQSYLANPDYSKTAVRETWRDWVAQQARPWLAEHAPVFNGELARIEKTDPHLLERLLS